jgi:hypothetical protein
LVGQNAICLANRFEFLRVFYLIVAETAVWMIPLGERFIGLAYLTGTGAFFEAKDL